MDDQCKTFRKRLHSGDFLVGTFLKTPSPISAEVLSHSTLDVFCIDAEHAPFGRLGVDLCIAAFRAADRPSIVRIPSDSPHDIRNALDSGATGVLVPHVTNAKQTDRILKASHFGEGGRGFAGSTRAAGYTSKTMTDHLSDSHEETTVIVQIEDLAALPNVAEIASTGVDAIFIGRADLAVAMGKSIGDDSVIDEVRRICELAKTSGTTVGMFTPNLEEIPGWIDAGASLFLLSSDQNFILNGANALAERFGSWR